MQFLNIMFGYILSILYLKKTYTQITIISTTKNAHIHPNILVMIKIWFMPPLLETALYKG